MSVLSVLTLWLSVGRVLPQTEGMPGKAHPMLGARVFRRQRRSAVEAMSSAGEYAHSEELGRAGGPMLRYSSGKHRAHSGKPVAG